MDNRCLGQPLDKEPATGTTADQFISPSGKGVTNVAIDTSDRWPQHGPNFAEDFRAHSVNHGLIESHDQQLRSEEHTSELQSLMRISYAVFCLKTKKNTDST